jgi:lysophospholipase L1-like esterase
MKNNSSPPGSVRSIGPLKTALFSVFIFILFLVALELFVRTTHLFGAKLSFVRPDPVLGFRFIPNAKYWYRSENDHPITGKINSHGWRDREWTIKKPEGTYRVAVLGDSYVEAFQVESDRTFLAAAEEALNKKGRNVEFMNFGRSGFTQTEELWILKNEVAQYSPDTVVLFFFPGNDIQEIRKETLGLRRSFYRESKSGQLTLDTRFTESNWYKTKVFINSLERRSVLVNFIFTRAKFLLRPFRKKEEQKKIKLTSEFMGLCTNAPNEEYKINYALNKRLIGEMAEYCKSNNMNFLLAVINTNAYIPENEAIWKSIDATFKADYFDEDLKMLADSLKIDYLGLQRVFRNAYKINGGVSLHGWDCKERKLIKNFPSDKNCGHWNYEGHKVVAHALAEKLGGILRSSKSEGW